MDSPMYKEDTRDTKPKLAKGVPAFFNTELRQKNAQDHGLDTSSFPGDVQAYKTGLSLSGTYIFTDTSIDSSFSTAGDVVTAAGSTASQQVGPPTAPASGESRPKKRKGAHSGSRKRSKKIRLDAQSAVKEEQEDDIQDELLFQTYEEHLAKAAEENTTAFQEGDGRFWDNDNYPAAMGSLIECREERCGGPFAARGTQPVAFAEIIAMEVATTPAVTASEADSVETTKDGEQGVGSEAKADKVDRESTVRAMLCDGWIGESGRGLQRHATARVTMLLSDSAKIGLSKPLS